MLAIGKEVGESRGGSGMRVGGDSDSGEAKSPLFHTLRMPRKSGLLQNHWGSRDGRTQLVPGPADIRSMPSPLIRTECFRSIPYASGGKSRGPKPKRRKGFFHSLIPPSSYLSLLRTRGEPRPIGEEVKPLPTCFPL